MSDALAVFCPAKVNLGLRVTGRRDDGYHLLDTLFCAIDLGDDLRFEPGAGPLQLDVVDEAGTGLDVPNDDSNLVVRAARRFHELGFAGAPVVGRLHLTKRVPAGGGLGGGSSDAAAALRLFALQVGREFDAGLRALALELGADVPFLLEAGLQRAQGVGESLESVEIGEDLHFVLALPSFGTSTGPVFRRYAQDVTAGSSESAANLAAPGLPFDLGNDLEAPARAVEPRLDALMTTLRAVVPDLALSGSGSTLFAVRSSSEAADEVELRMKNRLASADLDVIGGAVRLLRAQGPVPAPEISDGVESGGVRG